MPFSKEAALRACLETIKEMCELPDDQDRARLRLQLVRVIADSALAMCPEGPER